MIASPPLALTGAAALPAPPSRALLATAFFILALCWSPLLPGLLHLDNGLAFLVAFLLLAALTIADSGVSVAVATTCALLVVACLLLFVATGSRTMLARLAPVPMLLFIAHQAVSVRGLVERLCDVMSAYVAIGIVLCVIGFVYAWSGGQPLLSIDNGDGRENALYLTTMSNFRVGTVIRPSFIYDEPGAFSFLVCAVVAMRDMLGRPGRLSWFLMLGGLVTLSLTHMLILMLFLVRRLGFVRSGLIAAVLVAGALAVVSAQDGLGFVAERFTVDDGKLAGDNRSDQISNFMAVVTPEIFLFGDIQCQKRPERGCEEHGDISSSPVTPTYRAGLAMLLVQLWTHAALVVCAVRRRAFLFPALTLSLLLLQRPYFEGYGYGFITYIVLFHMRGLLARGGVRREAAS